MYICVHVCMHENECMAVCVWVYACAACVGVCVYDCMGVCVLWVCVSER